MALFETIPDPIKALGVEGLYLSGAPARDSAEYDSDVDIFVDRSKSHRSGFMELTELQFLLEEVLGTDVDLSTRTALHPDLSNDIEQGAIRVLHRQSETSCGMNTNGSTQT